MRYLNLDDELESVEKREVYSLREFLLYGFIGRFMVSCARGLLYEPTYESEVILLFGLLIPHFKDDFVIDSYFGSFPD